MTRILQMVMVLTMFMNQVVLGQHSTEPTAKHLPRSSPSAQGVSPSSLTKFLNRIERDKLGLHSFMLVRHGQVVAEGWWKPYDAHTKHELYSLSKSFTSTAVGLAIAEGRLSLNDLVVDRFAKDAPAKPSPQLKQMRLRDLLCMSTGHLSEPRLQMTDKEPWTKTFLAHQVAFKPGTHFLYNTPATYMQSAMVQQATGQTVLEYLKPRLFDPLGIEGQTWGASPQGVSLGGYGLNLKTEDIAKFGQLVLQQGKWNGKQLIPADWIRQATAKQTSNGSNPDSDWDQGYGFQFWRSRHNAFRGDGAFGQFCIVMPEQDAVISITSGTPNMQGILNAIWEEILPGMSRESLPSNAKEQQELTAKLAQLDILPKHEGLATEQPSEKSMPAALEYSFATNSLQINAVRLEPGKTNKLMLKVHQGDWQTITFDPSGWTNGSLAWGSAAKASIAAKGGWIGPDKLSVTICFRETPYINTVSIEIKDDDIKLTSKLNVSFGGTQPVSIKGKRQK